MRGGILAPEDMRAVLGSLLRSMQLAEGRSHFLFARSQDFADCDVLDGALADMEPGAVGRLASSFATMFDLAPEHATALAQLGALRDWPEYVFRQWRRGSPTVVFMTSGSTGQPVPCRQDAELLVQEIRAHADMFGDRVRILAAVPRHHIYGFLFAVLLPKALGVPVHDLPPVPSISMTGQLRDGDMLVAFPMFWKGLSQLAAGFPHGVQGITSTGPCPPEVIETLLGMGLQRMTEVYGSSETGGLGIRHDCRSSYTLLPFWRRCPDVTDDVASVIRTLPGGSDSAPCRLPDMVAWEGDRSFRPVRRTDKAVQVAGVNVYPDRIAAIIRSHPDVADCAVRPMRAEEGDRLKAFVVPAAGILPEALRQELAGWLGRHLTPPETPKLLTFGATLPVNAMGKASDWD